MKDTIRFELPPEEDNTQQQSGTVHEGELVRDENSEDTQHPAPAGASLPARIFLLPIKDRPFFPGQTLPVVLNKEAWFDTIKAMKVAGQDVLGVVFVTSEDNLKAKPEEFSKIGTLIRVHELKVKEDYIQLIAEGLRRFKIEQLLTDKPPFEAVVSYPEDIHDASETELKAYGLAIMNAFRELLPLNPLFSEELRYFLNRFSPSNHAQLADFAATLTTAEGPVLQDVLETLNLSERMEKVLRLIKDEIEVTRIQSNIRERVEENLSQHQREFFLKQQLKEIQKELGIVKDDRSADVDLFRERLENLQLSEEARQKAEEELEKLAMLDPHSPEYAVSRNWLDWITQLPWGIHSKDNLDLGHARKVLDRHHDGLEDVKQRILEFIAVGKLKGEVSGSIILLVGPPGVGKTSIGKSIAEALGRKFYRFSVGGMRDEAEIKGHRRTYIGAMPGKFIQALKTVGTANPVIMLDEVDKIGASYQGDPASALLEVLDPEQNSDFLDHYLDVRFDLSNVLFVCTANQLDTIPGPLLDRMEVIRLSGYITEEKVAIAKHHLWPKLLKEAGLDRQSVQITEAAIRHVIEGYAREAGVRSLQKQLGRIIRKAALKLVEGAEPPIRIHVSDLPDYLGQPRFHADKHPRLIGTVTGLAWTAMGGATLTIEATRVHTLNRGFKLSGQLGTVMQESANIAYSFISSHLQQYKADPEFFDKAFVHLHVPDGATPKDGPSAGITMATALLSLARGEPVQHELAMTGELSLTGQVLPVGGIREKVIAARRSGIKMLILPEDNRKDFEELPDYLKEGLDVHFARHYDDVARLAFNIRAKSPALKAWLEKEARLAAEGSCQLP
ncbi:ATP dependent PIM1 peptidase. Serine peptidase. MEROPS family S16 [Sulfurivirga caldicuralii]|uniref:Lon protease n=1 Tax=Sulfurivirga caldicuralii TaxID=364032 RepID=A0A1N6EU60_9GAMM|nr:endopeptidase La [Sulfurivirga caldicuralii]SIN86609.1 ATP dependent PIM1 peptidase. Serine peptidase. MEROPS family S16 [Sulfurivirga caldicuralii]